MPIQLYIALLVPQTTRGTWQEVRVAAHPWPKRCRRTLGGQ